MSACCVYDFTSFSVVENVDEQVKVIKEVLNKWCKKWCFQLEKGGESGKLHYQGRFSLKVKARETSVRKLFLGWHLSVTSNENRDNMFYVTKEDTREKGPWADTDKVVYIPRDIRKVVKLWNWQQQLVDMLKTEEDRIIDVIYDKGGGIGKSTIVRYCGVHGIGKKLPLVNDYKDILRMVMDMPKYGAYLIDMPRAMNKDRLYQFYGAIEEIKGGYAFDDRYHFKDEYFDPPRVVIFTNTLPDKSLLSRDRWKIWEIKEGNLEEFLGAEL